MWRFFCYLTSMLSGVPTAWPKRESLALAPVPRRMPTAEANTTLPPNATLRTARLRPNPHNPDSSGRGQREGRAREERRAREVRWEGTGREEGAESAMGGHGKRGGRGRCRAVHASRAGGGGSAAALREGRAGSKEPEPRALGQDSAFPSLGSAWLSQSSSPLHFTAWHLDGNRC
ncbi:SOSS complex subunit C isoform X1 [Vidua macroura]|uniref:SOSS complex subunit C isoform X1 n=1 Tax=Vidua macroura TaxID=187451 RepID=UPI0023A8E9F6|nr:SOSS complex subunit C isoform X1 [Vidua macroura]